MRSNSRFAKRKISLKAKLISVLIGAVLGWQVIAVPISDRVRDDASQSLIAQYSDRMSLAVGKDLGNSSPENLALGAREILASSPMSAESLRVLGFAEQGLGRPQKANALFAQAAALGWHDVPTQLWLAQAYLASNDYVHAAERMDAALRTHPESRELFRILNELLTSDAFATAMIPRLEINPSWRQRYFEYTDSLSPIQLAARMAVLEALANSNASPTHEEVSPIVNYLISVGAFELARNFWFRVKRAPVGGLYDPDFRHVVSGGQMGFEWSLRPLLGASAEVQTNSAGGGGAVDVSTDGSASGPLMSQLAVITPGQHRLLITKLMSSQSERAIGWVVRCFRTDKVILNTIVEGNRSSYSFSIPQGCNSQLIELRVDRDPITSTSSASFGKILVM